MSITGRSGQALAGSSIMGGNVPPCIQLGIDMSTKLLRLTNTQTSRCLYCLLPLHDHVLDSLYDYFLNFCFVNNGVSSCYSLFN